MRDEGDDDVLAIEGILTRRMALLKRAASEAGYDTRAPSVQAELIRTCCNITVAANLIRSMDRCGDYLRTLARQGQR